MNHYRLSIVVPMFNEEENAGRQLEAIQNALVSFWMPWEAIIVDDGSLDHTAPNLIAKAAELGPHFRIIQLSKNFKQTAAMQAGIDAARGEIIATMDGDLQNDPNDIPRLVERLLSEKLDMVAGWRHTRKDGFLIRRVPSLIANFLIRMVSGLDFQDLGCSLKVFRGSVLRQIRLYGEMHRFIPAWLATVTSSLKMAEEPVNHFPRCHGKSKYGISRVFRVIIDLLSMYFFLRFGSRPGHFFGGLGLLFSNLGFIVLCYLGILKVLGDEIGGRPLLWVGFFLIIAGIQLLTTGVLSEILMRSYFSNAQIKSYHTTKSFMIDESSCWFVSDDRFVNSEN